MLTTLLVILALGTLLISELTRQISLSHTMDEHHLIHRLHQENTVSLQPALIPDVSLTLAEPDSIIGPITLTGDVHYDPEHASAYMVTAEGYEDLSVSLSAYGCTPREGHIFVKDWSEHTGLAQAMETAGIAEIVDPIENIGPFNLKAYEMKMKVTI